MQVAPHTFPSLASLRLCLLTLCCPQQWPAMFPAHLPVVSRIFLSACRPLSQLTALLSTQLCTSSLGAGQQNLRTMPLSWLPQRLCLRCFQAPWSCFGMAGWMCWLCWACPVSEGALHTAPDRRGQQQGVTLPWVAPLLRTASIHPCNTMLCHVGARLLPASGPQWLSIVSVSAVSIHTAQTHPVELHARLDPVDLTVLHSMIKLQMSLRNGA